MTQILVSKCATAPGGFTVRKMGCTALSPYASQAADLRSSSQPMPSQVHVIPEASYGVIHGAGSLLRVCGTPRHRLAFHSVRGRSARTGAPQCASLGQRAMVSNMLEPPRSPSAVHVRNFADRPARAGKRHDRLDKSPRAPSARFPTLPGHIGWMRRSSCCPELQEG